MPLLRTQSPTPVQTRIPRNTEPLRARVPSDATVSPGKQNTSILWYKEAALVLNSSSLPHAHPDRSASSFAFSNYLNPSNSHLRHRHTTLLLFFHTHSLKIAEDLVPTLLLFSDSFCISLLSSACHKPLFLPLSLLNTLLQPISHLILLSCSLCF